jgi:hypothetical protein
MAARPELGHLIDALGGPDDVARESAVARLALMGARAADRLILEFPSATARARGGMLRAFEALADPRALPLVREALSDPSADNVTAAIGVLRAFLNSAQAAIASDALDAVVSTALDISRPAAVRLAALDALRTLPADIGETVRRNLARDPDSEVRARASGPGPGAAADDPSHDEDAAWRAAVDGRLPASPASLKQSLIVRRSTVRLTDLQHLVDQVRAREQRETVTESREQWRALRGALHQALAARNSRLALYDLRDSLADPARLPVAFLGALEEIGDATCLEALAAAYEESSRSGDAWWREHVAAAFRAIVFREGLTRRHAAVKRAMTRWPQASADLMPRT